jgi:hypothetical protein
MPGVGVAPGFIGLLTLPGAGIPGVGVAPFGGVMAFAGGIPGVVFVAGVTETVGEPGTISFAFVATFGATALFAEEFTKIIFALFEFAPPHANKAAETARAETSKIILSIYI